MERCFSAISYRLSAFSLMFRRALECLPTGPILAMVSGAGARSIIPHSMTLEKILQTQYIGSIVVGMTFFEGLSVVVATVGAF
jgi:hypothetical protein